MGPGTFKGGVHPYDGKELSKDQPITDYLPKGDLIYPLSQHIGAPATPIVEVGDEVLVGQKIAEAGGFVSAPIYASASGKVKAIAPHRVVVGDMVNSIVIENDGQFNSVEFQKTEDIDALSKDEIISKIKEAGVVGMGGAGFPTHVKLSPKDPDKIEYVIGNCAECEPYLTSDYRRMLEEPDKLVEGMKIILKLFDNAQGVLGVEDNKKDCIKKLEELTKDEPRISVMALPTKYPQGGERQLIYAVTGRAINSKMLPADAGCIVDNVDTIVSIYRAVKLGRPLMHRIVTITGKAINNPANYNICIGTNYSELIEAAGGFNGQPEKIISGGPMMGFSLFSMDIPTTKTTSALLCMTEDEVAANTPSNCINCGRCLEACPEMLVPSRLADFADNKAMEPFEEWNGMECIECGSCSYACPAKRNLAQSIKSLKKTIIASKRKK